MDLSCGIEANPLHAVIVSGLLFSLTADRRVERAPVS